MKPELNGKPVIVGPNPKLGAKRGVVLTCSYEAREFGVRSAMPILQAHKLCPNAEYSFSGFEAYRKESLAVMEVLSRFDPELKRVSIDEAYLDMSKPAEQKEEEIKSICDTIQKTVLEEVSLAVSIGASRTKAIAKIASQIAKPMGTLVIPKHKFREILDPLSLKIISGVGKKTYSRLQKAGYVYIGDVAKFEYASLPNKNLQWIWLTVHGIKLERYRKKSSRSHSKERTFRDDIDDHLLIRKSLRKLILSLLDEIRYEFKTITIKLRDEDFKTITRSFSFDFFLNPSNESHKRDCIKKANELINISFNELKNRKFRLLGVKASNFKINTIVQRSVKDFIE